MRNYPTLDPIIVEDGTFYVDRLLSQHGEVDVHAGRPVASQDVVARTDSIEKSFTLYLANELGVPNDSLRKYLAKSVGSSVNEGEPIARVRRGLRTAAVRSPATGKVVEVDDIEGTVTLATSTGSTDLLARVDGVVDMVHAERGVTIQTTGSRVYGVVGFGGEATGPLVAGSDRHDRELAADQVSSQWSGAVVLAGMTVGVPALNRMREVGVVGVIVGSLAEGDIRRFSAPSNTPGVSGFWTSEGFGSGSTAGGLVIVVTEGFGRLPMADPVFEFLSSKAGETVSVIARTRTGQDLARPEIYIGGDAPAGDSPSGSLAPGRPVRVVDTHRLGMIGTVESVQQSSVLRNGVRRECVEVLFENGDREQIPIENIEVLA